MSEAVVAAKAPAGVDLEPGTYWWCACGRSTKQPFCDGSHKGCGISPMKVEIAEAGKYWMCQCKATLKQPYCDGTHRNLP